MPLNYSLNGNPRLSLSSPHLVLVSSPHSAVLEGSHNVITELLALIKLDLNSDL